VFNFPILEAVAIDGDTIRCVVDLGFHISRQVYVRLNGVDAPEMRGPGKAAAVVVGSWVQKGFLDGAELTLRSHTLDKFGRVLGDIRSEREQRWLTNELLRMGFVKMTSSSGRRTPWTEEELAVVAAWLP
jgi:endonuclease YncB( thermonuclease family)